MVCLCFAFLLFYIPKVNDELVILWLLVQGVVDGIYLFVKSGE